MPAYSIQRNRTTGNRVTACAARSAFRWHHVSTEHLLPKPGFATNFKTYIYNHPPPPHPPASPPSLLLPLDDPQIPPSPTTLLHPLAHGDTRHQIPHRLLHLLAPLPRGAFPLHRVCERGFEGADLGEEAGGKCFFGGEVLSERRGERCCLRGPRALLGMRTDGVERTYDLCLFLCVRLGTHQLLNNHLQPAPSPLLLPPLFPPLFPLPHLLLHIPPQTLHIPLIRLLLLDKLRRQSLRLMRHPFERSD